MPPADPNERNRLILVRVMYVTAAATVVIAIVLGALVSPPLYAIALLAIVDLLLARAYATGKLTASAAGSSPTPSQPGDDASHNPYASED